MPDEAPPQTPSTITTYQADGTPLELPANAAQAAFKAGKVGFAQADRVHVKLADGRVGTVPGSGVGGALAIPGTSLMSPEEVRSHELAQQYGGVGGGLGALGLGVLRGGSFGLSDVAGKALLGDEYRETAEALKEAHPTLSGLGQVGGMIGLGALTGGSSLLEEGAAGALGESLLGKLGAHAIQGAVEGGYLGGGDAISENALSGGNHTLTAEKVFASMGENALYGAGLGAAGGLVGAGLGKVFGREGVEAGAKEVEALAEKKFGYVPEGIGEAAIKAQTALAGGGEDLIREAGIQNQSRAAKALRAELDPVEMAKATDDAARDVTDHVNTLLKDGADLADEAKGILKRNQLQASVSKLDPEGLGMHARETIGDTLTQVQGMIGDSEQFGQERLLGRMQNEIKRTAGRISDAAEKGDTAEQFGLLDDMKRSIGSWTRDVKATSLRSSTDPVALRQARATYQKLDDLYEGLRSNLENPEMWGKAAIDQRKINEAWSAQIAADRQFKSTLAAVVGEERFGGKIYAADPAKVSRYVSSLTNPDQDLVHTAITNYVKATQKLASTIGDRYELPAAKVAQVERAKQAADAFDKTLQEIGPKLAKANQLKALMANEGTGGSPALVGGMIGHALFGPAGGAVGAMAGRAVGMLSQPGRNMLRLAQIERMTAQLDRRVAKTAETFFERTRTGARVLKKTATRAGGALDDILLTEHPAAHVAKETAVEHAKETAKESIRERFEERSRQVSELAASPGQFMARMAAHTEGLSQAAPQTSMALGSVAAKAAGYLQSIKPTAPPANALTGKPGQPAASQMADYVRASDAVLRPTSLLDDLDKGRATSGQVQAVKTVYPQFYQELRDMLHTKMVDHLAKGGTIPYNKQVQVETLFDIQADPLGSSPAVNHAQATFAIAPKPTPPKPSPGKDSALADATETPAQKVEQGL